MLVFAAVTFVSTCLLCDCYMHPRPQYGPNRLKSYIDAVLFYLGEKNHKVCGVIVVETLYGATLAYVITSASSINAIQKSNCYHRESHNAACSYEETSCMHLFGAFQVVMSQIPNFHNMKWISMVAAIMSFAYASIRFILGFAQVIENGTIKVNIPGTWGHSICLPVYSHSARNTITIFFYLCCGCFGYAAFGDDTPGNLLTGFGFYEPYWLVDFANACIVLHLVGSYQIFSQPVFAYVERWFTEKFPNSWFVNTYYKNKLPLLPSFQMNPFKICFRTAYVASTTLIAMMFPYFNEVLGLMGEFTFWPLAFIFSSGNVLCADENSTLDQKMGCS